MASNPNPPSFSYAHAGRLVARALDGFLPPDRISTADFAAANRYLFNEGGGHVGRWEHSKAPYLVGIMDALDDTEHTTVAVAGPGQCGKNASAENWLMKLVCTDPANTLWYMPTQPQLESYVKRTINPMIEQHPDMLRRMGPLRTDNSLKYKGFLGMAVEFLPASHNNFTNKNAGRIVVDEYDSCDIGSGETRGTDPKSLADVRRSTYGLESKLLCISHGDRAGGSRPAAWNAGIFSLYRDSDQRRWWWACPHCGLYSSPNPGAAHQTALEYNADLPLDQIAASTHLTCPHNGCVIADHERRAMNLTGKWVGIGQQIDVETGEITGELAKRDIAGFWIVGMMSPFIFGGIGGLATALVKAQREYEQTGNDASLRQVVVKQLGYGYDPPKAASSVDAATLVERADASLALRTVPAGVRFITVGMDIQADRFELLFRGWGLGRESWVIEHRIVPKVDPATDAAAWDAVLTAALSETFPLADGSGRVMRVLGVGYDSQGEAGVTIQAMDAWRRAKLARRARSLGMISFRPAYTLLPLRGGSVRTDAHRAAKPLQVVYPEARSDRRSTARGDVPVGLFAPNWHKDALAAQLATAEPGPGYIHFPAGLLSPEAPHRFFEQLVAERREKDGTWHKTAQRNEALDLMVMSGVMAHLFAPSRFDWTRPPPWAREWDQNTMVSRPDAKAATQSAQTAPPARVQSPAPAALPARVAPPAGGAPAWLAAARAANGLHP
jgi:phage terminase large subunit GpA-like protein